MNFSFKEYYEHKAALREASKENPRETAEYVVLKYCKVPLLNEDGEREYVPLKPKDVIEILWEYETPDKPIARQIMVGLFGEKKKPAWSTSKFYSWVEGSTRKSK